MTGSDVRKKYLEFFQGQGHQIIPPAPLVLENDPTTLFTSSGMQPLVPYLLGQTHPLGKRLTDSQPSFRAQDIEEVGDNRHTTFFEMLGNWSLGDYFKTEQLTWFWQFLTEELNLPKEKLYVSVFEGNDSVPRDEDSAKIWKSLGVADDHIFYYGVKKNWWSRSGTPDKMPAGEPGGPDSEVFFEFTQIDHDPKFGDKCHPNCDCGRFMEIGNSVFMQYQKQADGTLKELEQKNVDFGGGLERLTAATNNDPDVFNTDLFSGIIDEISLLTNKKYESNENEFRIIADHIKAATFLVKSGVVPSNKLQGYLLRRLLRRAAVKLHKMTGSLQVSNLFTISDRGVLSTYDGVYFNRSNDRQLIEKIFDEEGEKFSLSLDRGLKKFEKYPIEELNALNAFDLYQSYGFPYEVIEELFNQKKIILDKEEFEKIKSAHQELSRTASKGMFKGGLQDHSDIVTKYHTATHLLHASLRKILGDHVSQKGSNITGERLRFDFSHPKKVTPEEIQLIEELINKKISEGIAVERLEMKKSDALAAGALAFFPEKYPEITSVYKIGDFSFELCGGPHVTNTSEIGSIKITRTETVGSGLQRIYATAFHSQE